MVNFSSLPCVLFGVGTSNRRSSTQYRAQYSSMTDGSYAFGSSFGSSGLLDCLLMDGLRVASSGELRVLSYEFQFLRDWKA